MSDPFSGSPFGGFDPQMFENVPLFRELARVMSWAGGPVNWDLATQTATAIAARSGDTAETERATAELQQAVDVAELWLDQVTALPAVDGPVRAYSKQEWTRLAASSAGLGVYVEPVADGMRAALGQGLPEELGGIGGAMGGAMEQAMRSMGAMLYGVQMGTVAGHLADQLLGTYDLGLPTLDPRSVGTVGTTAQRFADDYDFDQAEFRFWLALREVAHRRMFAGVPWLRAHVAALISSFASEADFDPSTLMDQLGGMGLGPEALQDPASLQEAMARPEAFALEPTTAQRATLARLQALVAFVEAYSDTVVRAAAAGKLTALPRIEEAARRRRAEKGPGEQFLAQLIGLDLKPGDFRLGASFCEAVVAARGQEGLDRVWQSADRLPTQAELADPSRWLVRMAALEIEAGIEADLGGFDEEP
ncbi:zinc-dependent metalloprotease [soil metagenome]|jgi:putative hydrolase